SRRLCPKLRAIALSPSRYWRSPVSHTFHGRDVFAPVAAHLSLGVAAEEMGEAIDAVLAFAVPRPRREAPGVLVGHIVHIDRFGNLVTDVTEAEMVTGLVSVEIAGHRIQGLTQTYAQGQGLIALIGSGGRLEIAARDGSAARLLGARPGDTFRLYVRT
ncbi:MAG: SAM-dependent chlorinase/fluorinase, partial [Chloroflexi bacterium]|nr:SAM-dependent chlorinase/fluorinase [Chloroflexota bacterium]